MQEPETAVAAPPHAMRLSQLCVRARWLASQDQRVLLGITGAPGAGKTTLARAIVDEIGGLAGVVGMDGFHLSQSRLTALHRLERKGAIDTFDGPGFVALVKRLRTVSEETVYAPEFRRDIDEPIAGVVAIEPNLRLIVVEGNYLLAPTDPWTELPPLFDEIWYCEQDEATRVANLIARHRAYGKSARDARRWALGSDQRNADLILATRARAGLIARMDGEIEPRSSQGG